MEGAGKLVYTIRYGKRMPYLEKEVTILHAFRQKEFVCKAFWDTGATATMITGEVVDLLRLEPIGFTDVTGVHGAAERPIFSVTLVLGEGLIFERFKVIGVKSLPDEHEALLGMDIISQLDFAVTNVGGNTTHSIRFPSMQEIDFEMEA